MATRKRYDVSPNGTMWKVTHAGSTLSDHVTKAAAVDAGVAVAKQNRPSQLVIHLANGEFEEERTYDNDPYPPLG